MVDRGVDRGVVDREVVDREFYRESYFKKIRDFCSLLNIINTSSAISVGNADLIVPILRRKAFKLDKVIEVVAISILFRYLHPR